MTRKIIFSTMTALAVVMAIQSCGPHYFRSNYNNANRLIHETANLQAKPFLKAHLKTGEVFILRDSWLVDTVQNRIICNGTKYNHNRVKIFEGPISIPIDDVAIFETNTKLVKPEEGRIAALSILAGLDVIVGLICLTNPKACFGSCPTFYIDENSNFHYSDAEGFSNAISPAMEYGDIDALDNTTLLQDKFTLTMKNEALETHCVRDVKLLACPRLIGQRVYQSPDNEFYLCENNYPLTHAGSSEGDVSFLLKSNDKQEWFSLADAENLSSKEEILLTFDDIANQDQLGLILNFRQTLMTTYFIYSAIGYMGDEVGDVFAQLERSTETKEKLNGGIKKELGDIDIYIWDKTTNNWKYLKGFYETGPIAFNRQLIPLYTGTSPTPGSPVKLKIVLNKGLWRIDYAALTNITGKASPIEISPESVLNKGKPDLKALNEIRDPEKLLISMPGDEYRFNFTLPDENVDYELFLYSKGYYLEWMREHWIKDKDLLKLRQLVYNPQKYLRKEAAKYKHYEADMEQQFWNSKVDTKTFVYHEK